MGAVTANLRTATRWDSDKVVALECTLTLSFPGVAYGNSLTCTDQLSTRVHRKLSGSNLNHDYYVSRAFGVISMSDIQGILIDPCHSPVFPFARAGVLLHVFSGLKKQKCVCRICFLDDLYLFRHIWKQQYNNIKRTKGKTICIHIYACVFV